MDSATTTAVAAVPADVAGGAFRRELWRWAALAIGALAIAGVFALLLALSRLPGIETVFPWPLGFFEKGLVIHVVFSFVVWFLAAFAALSHIATERVARGAVRWRALGTVGVAATAASLPLLFFPALLDRGEATLNNYVPAIINPLYYTGLIVMAAGVACAPLRLFVNLPGRMGRAPAFVWATAFAGGIYLVALICFGLAAVSLSGTPLSFSYNEDLFWGGGHVLQFLNTALLLLGWALLADGVWPAEREGRPAALTVVAALLLVAVLPAPFLYALFEPFSAVQRQAFTDWQYALGPPAVIMAFAVVRRARTPLPWRQPAFVAFALSMAVFFVGSLLGLFVDGNDTRTPAHYHGVIAGVTAALMGVFFVVILPALDRGTVTTKRMNWTVALFAGGQWVACLGLFLAGGYGAPRKTAGEAQGLEQIGALVGMSMNGIGGVVAVIGGVLFIWTVAAALLKRQPAYHAVATHPVAKPGGIRR